MARSEGVLDIRTTAAGMGGLAGSVQGDCEGKHTYNVFKTPLWHRVLKLDTDNMLKPIFDQ